MEDYLTYFGPPVGGLPVVLYCQRLPLGPVSIVPETAVGDVFPFRMLLSLTLFSEITQVSNQTNL
jgi:hypothetical protein